MTELTSETQAVVDAFYLRGMDKVTHDMDLFDLATALRVLVNSVVPEETEAPKAEVSRHVLTYKCLQLKLFNASL
jgi:hypothetical protein